MLDIGMSESIKTVNLPIPPTRSMSRAEWQMVQLVAADFQGEMKQHIVNLGGSLKDHLRIQLRSTLDNLLSEVFHVQSEGDRELNKPVEAALIPLKPERHSSHEFDLQSVPKAKN